MGTFGFTITTTDSAGNVVSGPVSKEAAEPLRGMVVPFTMAEGEDYKIEIIFHQPMTTKKE